MSTQSSSLVALLTLMATMVPVTYTDPILEPGFCPTLQGIHLDLSQADFYIFADFHIFADFQCNTIYRAK